MPSSDSISGMANAPSMAARAGNALIWLLAAAACAILWGREGSSWYLLLACSFAPRAPVGFKHPTTWSALNSPVGRRQVPRGSFSPIDSILSIVSFVLLLVGIGMGLFACSREPDQALLASAVAAAAPIMVAYPGEGEVPRNRWPEAWVRLDPLHVRATSEGIYLARSTRFVEERGIFIARSTGFHGDDTTDPSYRKLGPRVFAYLIKG